MVEKQKSYRNEDYQNTMKKHPKSPHVPNMNGCGCNVPTPDPEDKHAAFLKARKEYEQEIRAELRKDIDARTLTDDIICGAKSVCRGSVRAASGIIHAGARVGDAFERDLNRNSQSSIANRAVLRAMFEKHKAVEKKKTNIRVERLYKVNLNGKSTELTEKEYKQFIAAARSSPAPRKRR